jgi:hypothetical protein
MAEDIYKEAVERLRDLRQKRDVLPLAPDGDAQRTAVRELEDQAIRVLLDVEEETDEGALEAARESLNERRLFSVLLRRAAETLPTRPAPGGDA